MNAFKPRTVLLLSGLVLAGCSSTVEVLESTTVEIPASGGTISSADGLFGLRFGEAAKAQEVTIETVHDLRRPEFVSKVYLVRADDPTTRALEAIYDASGLDEPRRSVLATIESPEATVLSTRLDETDVALRASDVAVHDRHFVVTELEFRNGDCQESVCNSSCAYCDPAEQLCVPRVGFCGMAGECLPAAATCEGRGFEGWDALPTEGVGFVIDSLSVAAVGEGLDLDDRCDASGCADNAMAWVAPIVGDSMRQALLGGGVITVIELLGLDEPYVGRDDALVARLYVGRDADDPPFPANNFAPAPGQSTCCEFLIDVDYPGVPPAPRAKAPARIERGRLRTLAPTEFSAPSLFLGLPLFNPEQSVHLTALYLDAVPSSDLSRLDSGRMGAVLPARYLSALQGICNGPTWGCSVTFPEVATMLDITVAYAGPPDIDVDGDGLECVLDTDADGLIDRCCDGEVDACGQCSQPVPPLDVNVPGSCLADPRMADGYSIALEFTAVRAQILGVGN